MNSLFPKHYSQDEQPSSGSQIKNIAQQALIDGPLYGIPLLDETAKNKIQEVGDLLQFHIAQKEINEGELLPQLIMEIQERISHPIFHTDKSLIASAIFAHGFGKILCAENLKYIGKIIRDLPKMPLVDNDIASHIELIAYDLDVNFTDSFIRNISTHHGLSSALRFSQKHYNYFTYIDINPQVAKQYFICMKLLEQIEGEIATNSISSLNGNPNTYRSHYFDFIEGMSTSQPELLDQYKSTDIQGLESDYMEKLQALLETSGDDAVAAVTLMSESFIGLTYKTIIQHVLNEEVLQQNPQAKELYTFYQGHIELDGVEETNSTDTHFEMVKHMLTKVQSRHRFIQCCRVFIGLRNDVHNALMKQ